MIQKIKNKKFVFSISFSNFLTEKSGVPKVIMGHNHVFLEKGISYISIFSVKKTIFNDEYFMFCKYGIIVDGSFAGIYQMSQIIDYIVDLTTDNNTFLGIHIHHLMYNKLQLIENFLNTFFNIPILMYLHDYYICCSNYNLMKNGTEFCGGNGLSQKLCTKCKYYKTSEKKSKKIRQFIKKFDNRITFVTPSQVTKTIFINYYPEYSNKVIIIPHHDYKGKYINNLPKNKNIRFAFLAMPNIHKGWNVYSKISNLFKNYDFYVMNSSDDHYENMLKCKVSFTTENKNAMVSALINNNIDIAFLWSVCAETYSFTFDEAYSADCFIFTNKLSGNIRDSVIKNNNGIVFDTEEDLINLLSDADRLQDIITEYRHLSKGGPKDLIPNDLIYHITMEKYASVKVYDCCYKRMKIPVNKVLLFLLNHLYERKIINEN